MTADPRPIGHGIDPAIEAVVRKALSKKPADRHASAEALADDVAAYLAGTLRRPRSKRLVVRWTAAGVLVATAAIATVYFVSRGPTSPSSPQATWYEVNKHGVWIDPELEMPFIWSPPGTFRMGSDAADGLPDAAPHEVVVGKGFWLLRNEIPQITFEAVMGYNPSLRPDPDLPVESVSHDEAVEFCRKLSDATGRTYRLPTEIEWKFAARAGTTTTFPWGDNENLAIRFANFADQSTTYANATTRMPYNDRHPFAARHDWGQPDP